MASSSASIASTHDEFFRDSIVGRIEVKVGDRIRLFNFEPLYRVMDKTMGGQIVLGLQSDNRRGPFREIGMRVKPEQIREWRHRQMEP